MLVGKNVGTLQLVSIPTPLFQPTFACISGTHILSLDAYPDLHHRTFLSFSLPYSLSQTCIL